MTVELSEIQDSARQVLNGLGIAADEEKTWPLVLELGWLLVSVPEALGGLGQGLQAACALYKELGSSLASAPYLSSMLAIDAVCRGALPDRERWIERLTSSDYVAAPLADSSLSVARDGSGKLRLSGVAAAVPSVDKASHVLAYAANGECAALVPVGQAGVEVMARPSWDATRRLFDVQFAAVALDEKLIVASGSAAKDLSARLAMQRDFALAADSVGGATALLDMTVEYLQARKQFGRPLAMFQALKHRCADLKVLTSAAEALLFDSLSRLDAQNAATEAETMGKAAKYLACSVYFRVAEEALQLHGGIGMTSDHSCHWFLKRALLNEHLGRRSDTYEVDLADDLLIKLCMAD